MKKKYVGLKVFIGICALIFVFCAGVVVKEFIGDKKAEQPTAEQTEITEQEESTEPTEKTKKSDDVLTYKDFTAKIVNCELSKDDNGDDAVTLTMEFTNNSSEAASFNNYFYETVYQDGVEQSADNFYPGEGEWDTYDKQIKDGATITIYTQKPITDPTKPVEVQISSFMSNKTISKTFDLK